MIKLGIIGTGAISHHFIQAAHTSERYQLTAVYSRRLETASDFAAPYPNVALYDHMADFLASDVDVIYIASPNSLHFAQAKQALLAGKHVIVEKPAVTKPEMWQELVELAHEHEVTIMEAARNYHEKAFARIADFLADKTVLGAHFTYAKYSSKMPDLLAGKKPNVFSSRFAGGALMDLGIYPIYAAIRLFGQPQQAFYRAQQLENTIDLNGAGQLVYPDFQVQIFTGKNLNSHHSAEIYTADGTLTLDSIERVSSAIFQNHEGEKIELDLQPAPHQMLEEALSFADYIEGKNPTAYHQALADTLIVHQTLATMRKDAGIHFEEENHA